MTVTTLDWPSLTPTPPGWAAAMLADRDHLLVEQAHLEKKAASNALAFLFRWPGEAALQQPLSRLAREELVHFERVVALLHDRGVPFGPQRPGSYARRLKDAVRPGEEARLLDELMVAALIEERSCERMAALARALEGEDGELVRFYRDLVAAEARHRRVYLELAAERFTAAVAGPRWSEMVAHEAGVMGRVSRRPGLHSGWGGLGGA